jgi:uncharacterized OB-fold protein
MTAGYLCTRPEPTPDSAPFWDGLVREQFLVQRCRNCGMRRHYPRPVCSACHSMEADWAAIPGEGTIVSWTVCHHAYLPEFKSQVPYVVAIAELEHGIRVNLRLEAPPSQPLVTGQRVRVAYRPMPEGFTMPVLVLGESAP